MFWLTPCLVAVTPCNNKPNAWEVFGKLAVISLSHTLEELSQPSVSPARHGVKLPEGKIYFSNSLSVFCVRQVKFTPTSRAMMARFAHIYVRNERISGFVMLPKKDL